MYVMYGKLVNLCTYDVYEQVFVYETGAHYNHDVCDLWYDPYEYV